MNTTMSFKALFHLQDDMLKARVPLSVEDLQMKKGTAINKEVLLLKGVRISKLIDREFEVELSEGVYVVKKYF